MKSVLRDWVMELPLRHQGVLVAAVRGCDGAPKENSAKPIVRALRYATMNPADEREVGMASAFMAPGFSEEELIGFLKDWDHYPIHFVQHLMHACQVIGYCSPIKGDALQFKKAYALMVYKLHLNPETPNEMHDRLTEDRIAKYGNVTGEGYPRATGVDPIPASSTFSTERHLTSEPEEDPEEVAIVVTTDIDGKVRWETGESYPGSRVAHAGFSTIGDAVDDAVDRFHPSMVVPSFRKEVVP